MALHKDLTGVHVHEPKGIEDADDGTVYIADGSGSGAWGSLPSTLNTNILSVQHQGTSPQILAYNTWTTRTINTTLLNSISGATVNGDNTLTLPEGVYETDISASVGIPGSAALSVASSNYNVYSFDVTSRLYNNTTAANLLLSSNWSGGVNWETSPSYYMTRASQGITYIKGIFTLSSSNVVSVSSYRHGAVSDYVVYGGLPSGVFNVYLNIFIRKID